MDKTKVCLIIVFNHRYDENIDKLKSIYKNNFDDIYFLVPFYNGNKENVIPVYESSYTFQGYFAQAFNHIKEKYDYYVFAGDDLLINPDINSGNLAEKLCLKENSSYIKNLTPLSSVSCQWRYLIPVLQAFDSNIYLDYKKEIPPKETAFNSVSQHNLTFNKLSWNNLKGFYKTKGFHGWYRYYGFLKSLLYFSNLYLDKNLELPYPLTIGYSDFLVVSANSIERFCHLCGVFAAMNLFVEAAIPTSLTLSSSNIVTEKDINLEGHEIWFPRQVKIFSKKYSDNLNNLLENFDKDKLYVHPIKLSKWKYEYEQ